MSVIKKETIDVRRVDTALIGGDFTGNARGTDALDIQTTRAAPTEVASATRGVAIGSENTAAAQDSTAIGHDNTVPADSVSSVAIGTDNIITAVFSYEEPSAAIGVENTASGYYGSCVAIGFNNTTINTKHGAAAIGTGNTVSGYERATAIGSNNTASGSYSTAIGVFSAASGQGSVAAGYNATASGDYASALGARAEARIEKTTNLGGPIISRKDDGESAGTAFYSFNGAEIILYTKEIDLKVVATHTITLSANCKFWWNEMGIITTSITVGGGNQPTVSYGITGDNDKQLAAAITTALTAASKREIETPDVPEDGETSCVIDVTIASTYTTCLGRAYFRGMLVEDE